MQGNGERLDLIQLSIITIAVKNPGQFHYLCFFINRVDDAIFPLCHPKAGQTSVGEMRELFGIRRTGRPAETQNLEEDLAETFGIGMSESFECREDGI